MMLKILKEIFDNWLKDINKVVSEPVAKSLMEEIFNKQRGLLGILYLYRDNNGNIGFDIEYESNLFENTIGLIVKYDIDKNRYLVKKITVGNKSYPEE